MLEYGKNVAVDLSTFDDPQYIFLRKSLKAIQDEWEEINEMWENRQNLLSWVLNLQLSKRYA